jgi:NAD+ synthase (glutamine-hydrolysing)
MNRFLRVAGAQLDLVVGDLTGNEARLLESMAWAEGHDADVLLTPELAISGYPPEDLVLRGAFVDENLAVLERLAAASGSTVVVVGFIDKLPTGVSEDDSPERHVANAAAVLSNGEIKGIYHKVLLPNYGVFDEARYFAEGSADVQLWNVAGVLVGISICEDIWSSTGPPAVQAAAGARVLLNINGSPYHVGKGAERAALLAAEARRDGSAVVYVNAAGAQDELVFDGDSMVFAADGSLVYRAAQFDEESFVIDVPLPPERPATATVREAGAARGARESLDRPAMVPRLDADAEVYDALVRGLRGYVAKNGFESVVIGLSGGIDSALVLTISVDALGPESVHAITMPSRYSSEGSVTDSEKLAANLSVRLDVLPIDPVFASFLDALGPMFAGTEPNVAEENLQARIRGAMLMAVSNKYGGMVVATGNKSEMAVGYATLYGDMAGGYAVLKDVFKTLVYRLARWRNRNGEVIPTAIIDKPPSAELRPDQKDVDSLPPYDVLDEVLARYVEDDLDVDAIASAGFDRDLVADIGRMVDRNEYKRRQAPPGVRITEKAFGRDRRLPITNRFVP